MARENAKKRAERRFGRVERLADMIREDMPLAAPIFWPEDRTEGAALRRDAENVRRFVAAHPVVDMSNVCRYYYEDNGKAEWEYEADFPSCRPPFDRFFAETFLPSHIRIGEELIPFAPSFPMAWGWLVVRLDAASLPRDSQYPVVRESLLPMLDLPGIHSVLRCTLTCVTGAGWMPDGMTNYLPIDAAGKPLCPPKALANPVAVGMEDMVRQIIDEMGQLFHVLLLAMSFMNCKNVSVKAVEPDARLNRDRKRAGLKPFLRYHTIDIEPMKSVLRTEGNIESNGLKRALHICRGHFATYSDSFLGRKLDAPVTVWRPSHVRGSIKEGAVVSDYRVGAPKGGEN